METESVTTSQNRTNQILSEMITKEQSRQLRQRSYIIHHSNEADVELSLDIHTLYDVVTMAEIHGKLEYHSLIHLCENILLRCGFEKTRENCYCFDLKGTTYLAVEIYKTHVNISVVNDYNDHEVLLPISIEYLHELQNIASDFGTELTLNP